MARRPTAARSNESMTAIRLSIATTLGDWSAQPLAQGALALLNCLGYHSERMDSGFPAQPQAFVRELSEASGYVLDPAKIQLDRWQRAELLCQLSDEDVTLLAQNQRALLPDTRIALSQMESFLFVAIELADQEWSLYCTHQHRARTQPHRTDAVDHIVSLRQTLFTCGDQPPPPQA